MEIQRIKIHNYRSIVDAEIECDKFLMFVGANNAGKSNVINAIRCFYGDLKWTEEDFPKISNLPDEDSWVEITYKLKSSDAGIDKKLIYKNNIFRVRHYLREGKKNSKPGYYVITNDKEGKDANKLLTQKQKSVIGKIIYIYSGSYYGIRSAKDDGCIAVA